MTRVVMIVVVWAMVVEIMGESRTSSTSDVCYIVSENSDAN